MDFSTLNPDIWMVQWIDSRGEIERQDANGNNLNGLREVFIDVVPYCPLFQQFMRLLPGLLLAQAQKIQVELIGEVFDSKRQAPFHYPVAAGDYSWDATDATLFSSLVPALQNTIASLNQTIAALNAAIAHINSNHVAITNQNASIGNTLVAQINSTVVGGVNSAVVGGVNGFVDAYNSTLSFYSGTGDSVVTWINSYCIGTFNSYLLTGTIPLGDAPAQAARPGIPQGGIVSCSISWADPYSGGHIGGINGVGPGAFNNAAAVPWSNLAPVPISNTVWIPIGGTAPVNVTPAEAAAIMQGIAARTNDLNVKKNTKVGQVNALTDIDDVIDYDVTTGW